MTEFPFEELETDPVFSKMYALAQSARTEAAFRDDQFAADVDQIAGILEDPDNISGVTRRGDWLYSFERDAAHPRGLWRRIPQDTAPTPEADWQTVFDLDAFCAESGEDWHWRGAPTLWSNPDRVLIALSFQGSDQTRYLEWDCNTAAAVEGGFDIAPARCDADWLDADTLLLSTSNLPGAATRSGWQGRVLRLGRGMDLADAPVEFEVEHDDLLAFAYSFPLADGTRGIALGRIRAIGDYVLTLRMGAEEVVLDAPLRTEPSHNTTHYAYVASDDGPDPAGTLVLQEIDGADKRVLFSPSKRKAVQTGSILFMRDSLYWITQTTLQPTLWRLDLTDPHADPVEMVLRSHPQQLWVYPHDAVDDGTGPLQIRTSGFLTPDEVWLTPSFSATSKAKLLLSLKKTFDSAGMSVRLHIAKSNDGTEVPYHIVLPKDYTKTRAKLPVLQYGYGGFGASMSPSYQRVTGPIWLARGGAYVMSYIRGGAEFGKDWHLAAKRENRHKAFEDFAAIADDLTQRGYTTAGQIACHGGSNGGLLCGVMLTRYPEKFGAVWASVGVHDMLRFHKFPAGAAWIDEYGDPDEEEDRAWLLDYSPMHNVAPQAERPYPPALIDTNDSDDRVDPSHSRRFAAVLQEAGQPAHFHSRSGGHGGGGQSRGIAEEQALGYAFLRKVLKP